MAKKPAPSGLTNERTATIDLTRMLPGAITSSGSFDLRKIKAAAIGKLLQVVPIPTLLVDRSLHVVFANEASQRIIPEELLVGAGSLESLFAAPSQGVSIVELVHQVFSTRKTLTKDVKWEIEQTELWVRLTLRSVRIGGERFVLLLVEDLTSERQLLNGALAHETELAEINERLSQEIDQRIESEEALREREEAYRHLVEQATDAIYRTDADGVFTVVNPAVLRISGYTEDEMIGKHYSEVIHPSYRQQAERFYGIQFVKRLPQTSYEFPVLTKYGDIRWLEQSVQLLTEEDRVVGFQAVARDITDRKRVEAAFRREKERFQVLSEHAPFGMAMIAKDGNYEYINPKFREMFGYDLTEIPNGKAWFQLAYPDPEYRQTAISAWKEDVGSMGPGERRPRTFTVQCKDGTSKIVEIRSIVVRTGEFLMTYEDITERLEGERRLRESEERYRLLVDMSPDGIGVYSGEVFLFANEAGARLLGTTPENVVGRSVMEFVHPEFRDAVKERMGRVLESREAIPAHEAKVLGVDGSVRFVEVTEVPITYEGKSAGQLVTRDITESRQLQDAIRKSEANFREIFNSMNDAVFVHDTTTGTILDVNRKMCEMYGYSVEEARLLTVEDLSSGDLPYTQKEAVGLIRKALQGEPELFEWQAKTKDGRLFWVEVNLKRSLINERDVVLAVVRDITDRKKAEGALRESEARFREFAEAVPQAVYELDAHGNFTFLNRAGLGLGGYVKEDMDRELKIADLIAPEDHERLFENIRELLLLGEGTYGNEYTVIARDGTRIPIASYSSPIVKEDKVVGVRGVCVDIRKLKEAEEVLKRSRDELERLVAERTADLESSNKQLRKEIVEKIQAQESLAQSEGRFRAIFEKTPDCIFIKDLSLRYTMVNPSMENLMELPGSAIVGKTDRHLFGAEAAGHLESTDIRVLGGEVVEEEHSLKVKGAELTFLDVKAPLTDMYGQVVGLCGISRDITERRALETVGLPSDLPSESRAMRGVLAAAHLAAENDSTVLLTGESGSGKDYLARYIHNHSRRSSGPFYSINCASIPAELAESELFGHEAGAFTGATKRKRGLLELAEGGTILLNEIGELSQGLQAKLLAFLDTRTFTRVGGEKDVAVNVRLIAATNRNLREEISAGRFRQDLFYRLDVFSIRLPPLRGRLDDLPRLVNEFIERLAPSLGYTGGVLLDPRVMDTLRQYAWPGNVRELLCTAK